jgi:GNAT superfamily N-acetyltransferase
MRGFGVAQHLIDEAEKVCGRSGCKITQLMISEQQDEARELLESMGYQVIDGERMEKDIRWKSCHTPPDDIAAEELCRADLDAALG